ncbi:Integrase/recombinase xerD like protein [Termitomyces sp. T112]|nr:Integrase/recombinase xerD like protein [Termitomyces sp. T112]
MTPAENSMRASVQQTLAPGAGRTLAPHAERLTTARLNTRTSLTLGKGTSSLSPSYLEPLNHTLPISPPCPNTDPCANAPLLDTTSLLRVSSSLNEEAWLHYLCDYPSHHFVSTLFQIICFGANLGFMGDPTISQHCVNLKSATSDPQVIETLSADIATQVTNGRMCGPFTSPPFSNFCTSPIRAITRKRLLKVRRIHHLSWPQGSLINDGIPDAEATIIYDMVEQAIHDLAASGLGSLMLKLDLESVFHHIPIQHVDWPLLGFEWLRKLYYNIVLVFGARSAPYIFNLFAEALHWILQRNIPAWVCHYLNNFLAIFPPASPPTLVSMSLSWALKLGDHLGLTFQPTKMIGPNTTVEFLGLELDSRAMEVRLPQEKLEHLHNLMDSWAHQRCATHCELDELTGFLQFASQVIPAARAFIHALYNFATLFLSSPFASRHIPKAARLNISWWNTVAPTWNRVWFVSPNRSTINIYTDASGAKGLGGHFGAEWFMAHCPRRLRHEHIQVKEMFAVVHAILCWGKSFHGSHVVFHVDNEAIFNAIRSKTIRSAATMKHHPQTVIFYLWHELAASTRRTYSTGQQQFILYTQLHNLYNADGSILPASEPTILSWVASLGSRVQPKTIKAYLSAVHSLHVDANLSFMAVESPLAPGPTTHAPHPLCPPCAAQPWVHPRAHGGICCVLLAYSGLLRSSEFTVGKGGKFNASLNLSRNSIEFLPSFKDATHARLTLPASKTDPFRQGVTITIAATPGCPTCPIAALKALFSELPHNGHTPLLEQPDGSALSYTYFVATVRNALSKAGFNPHSYAGHSFRHGAASAAAAARYSNYDDEPQLSLSTFFGGS